MTRKALLIPAMLVLMFLMFTSMPKWVNTTQAADLDTYVQIIQDLNTPYEDELVTLLKQLNQYLYEGNIPQAKQIGEQLNQILDKLPKDQQDALTTLDCDVTEGPNSCNVTNCNGFILCDSDPTDDRVFCFCSRNGQCAADCENSDCSEDASDEEAAVCACDEDGRAKCATGARMPLASTIGILVLVTLIVGSGIWLWRRRRVRLAA